MVYPLLLEPRLPTFQLFLVVHAQYDERLMRVPPMPDLWVRAAAQHKLRDGVA